MMESRVPVASESLAAPESSGEPSGSNSTLANAPPPPSQLEATEALPAHASHSVSCSMRTFNIFLALCDDCRSFFFLIRFRTRATPFWRTRSQQRERMIFLSQPRRRTRPRCLLITRVNGRRVIMWYPLLYRFLLFVTDLFPGHRLWKKGLWGRR